LSPNRISFEAVITVARIKLDRSTNILRKSRASPHDGGVDASRSDHRGKGLVRNLQQITAPHPWTNRRQPAMLTPWIYRESRELQCRPVSGLIGLGRPPSHSPIGK
jgi:hypothetical protein